MNLVFADVESTGIRKEIGAEIWEVALIVRRDIFAQHPGGPRTSATAKDAEYAWQVRPDLVMADPGALKISGYYRRCRLIIEPVGTARDLLAPNSERTTAADVAARIAGHLDGALIIGANPWFDAGLLDDFLRDHGQCMVPDYHMRDIGSLVTGYLAGHAHAISDALDPPGPLKLTDAARAVGLDPGCYEAHTAHGDVKLARDIWDAVFAGSTP